MQAGVILKTLLLAIFSGNVLGQNETVNTTSMAANESVTIQPTSVVVSSAIADGNVTYSSAGENATSSAEGNVTSSAEAIFTSSAEENATSSAEGIVTSSAEAIFTPSAGGNTTSSAEGNATSSAELIFTSSAGENATSSAELIFTSSAGENTTSSAEGIVTSSAEAIFTSSAGGNATSSTSSTTIGGSGALSTTSSPMPMTSSVMSTSTPTSSMSPTMTPTPQPIDDSVLPFLEFNNRKMQLRQHLDGVSNTIYIPNGFPFGLQTHTEAYVGTNGVISFSRPFYYWWPSPFPGFYYLRRFYVVAPYWSDHDIRSEGEVSYETFEKGRSSYEDMLLDRVNTYLNVNTTTNFTGTFMILAEWRDVHPYPHGYISYFQTYYPSIRDFTEQANTYQAVVITDGSESYAVFTYMCDLMEWSGRWRYPTIGFNAAGILFANHPLTARKEANTIDCIGGNQYNNVPYKISADPDVIEQLRKECLSWYFSDIESYGSNENVTDLSESQISCPCTWRQARWERRFWFFTVKDNSFCYIQRFPNIFGGAQECCYSRSQNSFGALVLQGRSSGGLLRYHPFWSWTRNYPNYIKFDRSAQETCCLSQVGFCKLYHERRPLNDCAGYAPQRRTWGWGDPHITTIDGRRYTFNGWGEYVLLRTTSSDFEFQGRTERAPNSDATIFSAFVITEGDDTAQVGINRATNDSFTVLVNGNDKSNNLTSVGDNVTSSLAFVEQSGNNSISVSFPSGVGITINITAGLLVYTLEVPPSLEGTTSGLLGNYNGNDSDEFVFRNGTMISNTSSDATIHEFGQSWQVTENETLFTYGPNEDVDSHSFPNHIPPFLDQMSSVLLENTTLMNLCGDNLECLFDFGQTGDADIGMAAMMVENQTNIEMQDAFSFPPNITAPEIFLATVGNESVYTFTVTSDSDNINVMVLHGGEDVLPDGVVVNDSVSDSYSITWTADNSTTLNLTIVASDPSNEISSMFTPTVHLCACENGGNCTTNGLLNTDFSFVILNCECPGGYDGEFCQNDADGCNIVSCLEGQQCMDYPAPMIGANCSCPSGYVTGNNSKCVDIDECANSSSNVCTQQCVNIPGSYQCDCYDGYRPVDVNATQCEDIDECMEYNDCHQICNNTAGSYECSCDPGFMITNDNRTCAAVTPCSAGNHSCQVECAVVDSQPTCFCPPNFEIDPSDMTACRDINECTKPRACEQLCNNTNGSFICSCNSGYAVDGRRCNDIDECLNIVCPSTMLCVNTNGSHNCRCPPGTTQNGSDCTIFNTTTPSPSPSPSPTPTPTPTIPTLEDDDGFPGGVIAGIVIACVAVTTIAAIIVVAIYYGLSTAKQGPKVTPEGGNLLKEDKPADLQMEVMSTGEDP